MRGRTLAQLRTDVRRRADIVNSDFISDDELNELINGSIAVLYGKLVGVRGQEYYEKNYIFSTVAGNALYYLPTDFWQLSSVEIQDGSFRRVIQPFMRVEHARWAQYAVPGGYPITVYYVPAPQRLESDSDFFDGIAGWEEWVVLDAAIKCLQKEESDVSVLAGQKAAVEDAIRGLASERDGGFPERVADMHRQTSPFVFTGGVPRYRLRGATGVEGAGQHIEILWGPIPNDWFGW